MFVWTEKFKETFQSMKQLLTTSTMLVLLQPNELYDVYCDACHQVLGCVLMQHKRVMVYASIQLKTHESN